MQIFDESNLIQYWSVEGVRETRAGGGGGKTSHGIADDSPKEKAGTAEEAVPVAIGGGKMKARVGFREEAEDGA